MQHVAPVEVLSSRVIRVLGMNPGHMTLQGTNCYLIGTGPSRILLDTGEGQPAFGALLQSVLQVHGITSLSHVLLTHYHHDHIGGIDTVQALFPATPLRLIKRVCAAVDAAMSGTAFEDIADGAVVSVPGATLRAIATPGHTPDHMAFFLEEEQAVFSGDTVLGEGTCVFQNLKTFMDSLEKLLQTPFGRIYPGHGPVLEDGMGAIRTYLAHRTAREGQILAALHAQPVAVDAR